MSKKLDAIIKCPQCSNKYDVKLYRTVWGEYKDMRDMVLNDKVNICTCPHCNYSFKAPYPFMYVDVKAGFAVWWEPTHDTGIDSDTAAYARMFGAKSYYATAPRVQDWQEFKNTIMKYYRGELVGGKVEKMDFSALKQTSNTKGRGCVLSLLLILVTGVSLAIL